MADLSELYRSVENPMNNREILKKIIGEYEKSDRANYRGPGIYEKLVKLNGNKDNSVPNVDDMEKFYVKTYNQWKNNLMRLTPQQVEEQKRRGLDIEQVRDYLTNFGEIRTMEDVNRLKQNPLFDNELNSWELEDGWTHIKSRYINARQESRIDVKHRLYIGSKNQDIWKMMDLFKTKCEEQGIPYYFKSATSSERDDKIVIYSDTQNLSNYVDILREIATENPEIISRTGQPPALTGKIDNWIGVGDEPPRDDKGDNHSYNEIRAKVIEDSIEEELLKTIINSKGKDIVYAGKNVRFNDLFIETATQQLIDKLKKGKDKDLKAKGLVRADLTNEKFKAHLQKQLRGQIQKGLNELWNVKDDKYTRFSSNFQALFNLPTREGRSIGVSLDDMDKIIKSMLPVIQKTEPQFLDNVSKKIEEKSIQQGIDSNTFCFSQETKEKFEQISGKTVESRTEKTATEPQKQKWEKQEFVEGFISAYNITEEEYQKEKRIEDEEIDIDRVKQIIETKGLNRMLTSDLEGKWIETLGESDFKVQYSQKQVSAMARLLKAAEKLTNDKQLNPEGRNYLDEFANVPDIDYKLKQLREDFNDENSYMSDLRQKARDCTKNDMPQSETEEKELPSGRASLGLHQPPNKYVPQSQTKASKFFPKHTPEKKVKASHLKEFAEEMRAKRQIVQGTENNNNPEQDTQEVKKSDKFKPEYKVSAAREKLLENKSSSLKLQQEIGIYMLMAEEEKTKKQPTISKGMRR